MPSAIASSAAPANAAVAAAAPVKPVAMPSVVAEAKPIAAAPAIAPKQPLAASSPVAVDKPSAQVKVAALPVVKPITKPAHTEPAIEPSAAAEEEPAENYRVGKVHSEFAPIHAQLLEASIHSQLVHEGYPSLGVSVTAEGDVYLDGTFLSQADQDRVIHKVRAQQHVRDIYFSGTVWHNDRASAPEAAPVNAGAPSASPVAQQVAVKPAAPPSQPVPSKPKKVVDFDEFPVTAADASSRATRYAASPAAQPSPLPTP